jgi:hypothetical protein
LAEEKNITTLSPSAIFCPPSSVSQIAVRRCWLMGLTQWTISSAAAGIRAGSASSRCRWSGCWNKASMPPDAALRVVSWRAEDERHEEGSEFHGGELIFVLVRQQQLGDDVVARLPVPLLALFGRVGEHLRHGLRIAGGQADLRIIDARDAVRQLVELPAVRWRGADQIADHLRRQQSGNIGDEVGLVPPGDVIQQAGADLGYVLFKPPDHPRRENRG